MKFLFVVFLIMVFCAIPTVAEAQQTRDQCIEDCQERWQNLCPKVAEAIYNNLVARGVPNANAIRNQLLAFCEQGYELCIANCPVE